MTNNERLLLPQGWECPRCRSIHSPYKMSCDCVPATVPAATSEIKYEFSRDQPHEHYWEELNGADETGCIIICKKCSDMAFIEPDEYEKFKEMRSKSELIELTLHPNTPNINHKLK